MKYEDFKGKDKASLTAAIEKWHSEIWSEELSEDTKAMIANRVTKIYKYGKTFGFSFDTDEHMWDFCLNSVINGRSITFAESSDYSNNLDKLAAYAVEQGYDNVIPSYGPSIEYMRDVYFNLVS